MNNNLNNQALIQKENNCWSLYVGIHCAHSDVKISVLFFGKDNLKQFEILIFAVNYSFEKGLI